MNYTYNTFLVTRSSNNIWTSPPAKTCHLAFNLNSKGASSINLKAPQICPEVRCSNTCDGIQTKSSKGPCTYVTLVTLCFSSLFPG